MKREIYISDIEAAISSMHAANKTISNSYGSKLGLLELAILSEIKSNPKVSSEEIALSTHSSAVKISRCIKSLVNSGLLLKGSRNKTLPLMLTKEGNIFFNASYKIECKIFAKALKRLPVNLHSIFKKGIDSLNLNLKANRAANLKDDPVFLKEIRKLTRSLGFLSGTPYNYKGLSSLEWHILRAFYSAHIESENLTAKVLASRFAIPIQTIFSALKKLESLSLLQQKASIDRREKALSLSKKGVLEMERCLKHAKTIIGSSLTSLDIIQLRDFSKACLYYSGIENRGEEIPISPSIAIRIPRIKKDFELARKLIYKARVFSNSLEELPSCICSHESNIGIVYQHNVALAVIEIKNKKLLNFVCIPDTIIKSNIRKCFQAFLQNYGEIITHDMADLSKACTHECYLAIKRLFL